MPTVTWKSAIAALGGAAAIAAGIYRKSTSQPTTSWLESERSVALSGILANITQPGIIVASPSTSEPDYFYTWTRDTALTIEVLVNEFTTTKPPELEKAINDYINAQAILQRVDNSSGGLHTGGLGEAKFNVNLTAFTGDWGRPQRDGPALRAIALIAYSRHLIFEGQNSTLSSKIWPILQNDLSYVTQSWNLSTFDLWEEVNDSSFFTTAMQYCALVQGSQLARDLNHSCDVCSSEVPKISRLLQSYWNHTYIISNTAGGRSGKDLNSILTSTHMFDSEAGCNAETFQPCSDKALANHKVVTDSFRPVYAINKDVAAGVGVAVGRYPEDVYMGGNPW